MKWYRSKWFIVIVAVSVYAGGSYAYLAKGKKTKAADVKEVTVDVKKGNIRSSVSGTAQFEPKDKTMNFTGQQKIMSGVQFIDFGTIKSEQLGSDVSINLYEVVATPNGDAKRLVKTLKM
ncbi:hypothetical protein SAMN04487897_105117 [Paenibacillus sp. yr247]|uniref:hypothetical protein n=1 Tax=Paenibacillus sp. yr247 TaxID=1761880 RepID=UPI00088F60DD|nr:hypothetical protein [Paenibacillus sp. yr247]SDN84246.1 hypothetical protein SAMN04487897_105117 [Paenibacillus sp. yr247]